MYTDILGKLRFKVGLHVHTRLSDGQRTPEEAAQIYKDAGFDAIAITDHWKWYPEGELCGLRILGGAEYNTTGNDTAACGGVIHLLGIGAEEEPQIERTEDMQAVIDAVHAAGGLVVLAHPAWSLNSLQQIKALSGIDATEIFNTVSGHNQSARPYSGYIVDLMARDGMCYPLVADDDTHFYTGEECVAYIMVDVTDGKISTKDLIHKIGAGEFYATQGPEIHIFKNPDGTVTAKTSPCSLIAFYSQASYNKNRCVRGENVTQATYAPKEFEKWIRAECVDADGKTAWSNIIAL